VFEASAALGGKAGHVVLDGGVTVDTGPSLVTLPEVFRALFADLGASLDDHVTLLPLEPAFRYLWPDGTRLDLHRDVSASIEAVRSSLGGAAAQEFADFLTYAARIYTHAAPPFLYGAAPSASTLAALGVGALGALAHIDPLRTMDGGIRAHVRSPHLIQLFQRFATYNGSDPRRAPATLNLIPHVEIGQGGWGVRGGIHMLVRALAGQLERLGVTLRTGAAVQSVRTSGRRVCGVVVDHAEVPCDAVVCNADPALLAERLLPHRATRAFGRQDPSMSGWTAVVRTRRQARAAHTVLFPTDYSQEFADIFDRTRPPQQPAVYLCSQEQAHGCAGWADSEPVFVMANAPAEPASGSSDPDLYRQLKETVLSRARGAGLIDPDCEVAWERTPTQLAGAFPGSRGAIYGSSSNGRFAAFSRPPNRVSGVPGLYLASGGAHPGGGLPLCVLSGRRAAEAAWSDHH
jgi:phytoene desaturase